MEEKQKVWILKLPEQEWKDGDVLVCDEFPWDYAVFKKYLEDDMFEAYFIINEDGVSFNATEPVKIYHLANEKEFEDVAKMLFTASRNMFEVGKKLERKKMRNYKIKHSRRNIKKVFKHAFGEVTIVFWCLRYEALLSSQADDWTEAVYSFSLLA